MASVFVITLVVCFGSVPTIHAFVPSGPVTIINGASYGTLGSFKIVSVNLTNYLASSLELVVFAVWKNASGQTIAVSTGGLKLASGATGTTFAPLTDELPRGTYSVSVFVVDTNNNPVSSVTSFSVVL